VGRRRWESRSKLGRAHLVWLKHMSQFQTEVPDPLRHVQPGFLPPGRMAAPAIRIDLLIFIVCFSLSLVPSPFPLSGEAFVGKRIAALMPRRYVGFATFIPVFSATGAFATVFRAHHMVY